MKGAQENENPECNLVKRILKEKCTSATQEIPGNGRPAGEEIKAKVVALDLHPKSFGRSGEMVQSSVIIPAPGRELETG